MDNIQSINSYTYTKSVDLEEITAIQRAFTIGKVLPSLVLKTLIVSVAAIYYLLLAVYHYFIPKALKDIRGQLAVVSKYN